MKTGLVLEGGGMRGMFTCGVIDVLMENNITVDGTIGVSAGAAFGCNLKSKQIDRPHRYNMKYCKDPRYSGIKSWIKTGDLYNVDFCYDDMIYVLDPWDQKTFEENPMEFYCVVTDIETGQPVYHKFTDGKEEDVLWIRASASMPLASRPVEINGGKYLDGGISDSVPIKYMESLGYDRIMIVETQPYDYVKKPQKLVSLFKVAFHNYPCVTSAMLMRYSNYNKTKEYIKQKEKKNELLVLRPKESLNIFTASKDPAELDRVYQLGREVALERLEEIKAYLNKDALD